MSKVNKIYRKNIKSLMSEKRLECVSTYSKNRYPSVSETSANGATRIEAPKHDHSPSKTILPFFSKLTLLESEAVSPLLPSLHRFLLSAPISLFRDENYISIGQRGAQRPLKINYKTKNIINLNRRYT